MLTWLKNEKYTFKVICNLNVDNTLKLKSCILILFNGPELISGWNKLKLLGNGLVLILERKWITKITIQKTYMKFCEGLHLCAQGLTH